MTKQIAPDTFGASDHGLDIRAERIWPEPPATCGQVGQESAVGRLDDRDRGRITESVLPQVEPIPRGQGVVGKPN